jgi:phosphoglycolate phosphatase
VLLKILTHWLATCALLTGDLSPVSPSLPLLLLWDIDGTLLSSSGAGLRALRSALQSTFSISGSLDGIEFAGRTDPWIIRQIFQKFDLPLDDATYRRYFDAYIGFLPGEMQQGTARVLPGVRERLAEAAARPHVTQGLLTGNQRQGARVKLEHHGLWDHFPFGAFADDHEIRNELGPHALRRAKEHRGYSFSPHRTWIIGDTPHDIACGRAIGARTLAVATGHCEPEVLRSHQPDGMLTDLADAEAFWGIVDPRA